jgi:hypothetical protein
LIGYLAQRVNKERGELRNATRYLFGGHSGTTKSGGSTTRRGHDDGLRELQLALDSGFRVSNGGACAGKSVQGCGGQSTWFGAFVFTLSLAFVDFDMASFSDDAQL